MLKFPFRKSQQFGINPNIPRKAELQQGISNKRNSVSVHLFISLKIDCLYDLFA